MMVVMTLPTVNIRQGTADNLRINDVVASL